MRKVLLQLFFALTLLGSSLQSLYGEESQLQILPQEVQEVVSSSKTYLFIGEELTQIKSIVSQARALSEDALASNSLDQLLSRYEQGFKTAPEELVVSALEEAEQLIEKRHEALDDAQLSQISESFAKCCKQIDDGELLISVNKNATRSPRDPQAPGGALAAPAAEAGTLVPTNEPSKDLFVENDLTVGGDMDIHGDTHYAGNVLIDGTLTVGLSTTLNNTLSVVGETVLNDTLYPLTSIEAGPSGILNIGITDDTDVLNLGTAGALQEINVGTGAGTTTINLGGDGDTVNVYGTTNYIGVNNLEVKDKNIIINKGGEEDTATQSGINIEEAGSITGYIRTNGDRSGIEFKAPAREGLVIIKPHATILGGDNFQLMVAPTESLITERNWESVFVGRGAGNTTMTGTRNCGLGAGTLQSLTTGTGNVGIGHVALADANTGSNNVCIGNECGNDITTGSSNIAIGNLAARALTNRSYNIAIGELALKNAGSTAMGDNNIVIGYKAAGDAASGGMQGDNIIIGSLAGKWHRGSRAVIIGTEALELAPDAGSSIAIGYRAGQNCNGLDNLNNIYIGANQKGGDEDNVIRIGSWNDDYDTPLSTACYINGIVGQNTTGDANVALISPNDHKLGTGTTSSAILYAPVLTINNGSGAAALALQDNSGTSVTWSLIAGRDLTTDFEMQQNGTTRLRLNTAGIRLSGMSTGGANVANGNVPMIVQDSLTVCPRILYGRVESWTSANLAGTPVISGSGGWAASQIQGGVSSEATFTFAQPFTQVPTVLVEAAIAHPAYATLDSVTTDNFRMSFKNEGGGWIDRWERLPHFIVIGY